MNVPKLATQEWLEDLTEMTISAQSNEFLLKRIERDAWLLLERSAERRALCWLVLAFIAFLRGDRDECIRCVEAAYALAKYDVLVVGNAASLMVGIGVPELAAKYARQLAAISGGDARIALHAARSLFGLLLFEEAATITAAHDVQRALVERDGFLIGVGELATSFQSAGVDAEVRMAMLELANSTVRAAGCTIRRVRPVRYADDTLRYEFYVDQSASQCGNVNFAIAEALTAEFDDAHPELITFACRPLTSFVPSGTSFEIER